METNWTNINSATRIIVAFENSTPLTLFRNCLLIYTLFQLKEMNHENVNKFIGLSFNDGPFLLRIWVYCTKRSLQQIIFNEDIHLDDAFKVSILHDVVKVNIKIS